MPALPGRRPRVITGGTSILQARVNPELRDKAHRAAEALGVSMAAYVEALIEHDELDHDGRPTWWPDDADAYQGELPLQSA